MFLLFLFYHGGAAFVGWKWFRHQPSYSERPATTPGALNANEKVFNGLVSDKHLAKEYDKSKAPTRAGEWNLGLRKPLDSANWAMNVIRLMVIR
jgi:hypothetical protein